MKPVSLIFLLFSALLSVGCGAPKAVPVRDAAVRDSVTVALRTTTRTELVPVLVQVPLPEIRETRRNVRDSVDVIENDYAVSTVTVHPDGSFDHGLATKPRMLEQQMDIPVQATDSSFVKESAHSMETSETVTVTQTVNVLKWWQKALIWLGATFLAILLIKIIRLFK